MESTKMFNLFSAMLAMMAVSAVPLSAADPPAPAPTSDADIAFVSIAIHHHQPQTTNTDDINSVHHPLYFHQNDHPGLVLISKKLTGSENYSTWRRSMMIALNARNKLKLINGEFEEPSSSSAIRSLWERANDMIISWILNTVYDQIGNNLRFVNSATSLWNELYEHYSQLDGHRIYQDELDALEAPYACTCKYDCENGKTNGEREQRKRLIQFLMGLDDSYTNIRGQILLMQPLPLVSMAYGMLRQEEKQRDIPKLSLISIPTALNTFSTSRNNTRTNTPNTTSGQTSVTRKAPFRKGVICTNCQKEGHYGNECYKIVGFPPGHPLHGKFIPPSQRTQQALKRPVNVVVGTENAEQEIQPNLITSTSSVNNTTDPYVYTKMDQLQNQLNQMLLMMQNQNQKEFTAANLPHMAGKYIFITSFSSGIKEIWIIDSGATDHICICLTLMFDLQQCPHSITVNLPNGDTTTVTMTGSVHITPNLILKGVFYIPTFTYNLISISKITNSTHSAVIFTHNQCTFQGHNGSQTIGNLHGGLYTLTPSPPPATSPSSPSTILHTSSSSLWHARLEHPLIQVMKKIKPISSLFHFNSESKCTICPLAKHHVLPFLTSTTHATSMFSLVHIDAFKDQNWRDGMTKEIQALENNKTWIFTILPPGKTPIRSKWVYKIKLKADEAIDRYKARLVAKGFNQKEGIDYTETFALVAKMPIVRTLIAIALHNGWPIQQLDVNNAFLHGDLNEEVYMTVPQGYPHTLPPNTVCKLTKSLYGLKQANRQWFEKLTTFLLMATPMDPIAKLNETDGDPLPDPTQYRTIVGKLIYLTLTRPDLSFAAQALSQFSYNPRTPHLAALQRVMRYIKLCPGQGIYFPTSNKLELTTYCDSDWASCQTTRRSVSCYAIFLGNGLISWQSKKQLVVSRSSTEAEYRSLADSTCEISWLKCLLHDLGIRIPTPSLVMCDNASTIALANNPVQHARTKHIEIDCHFVRDKIRQGHIKPVFVSSQSQVADILTKGLSKYLHYNCLSKLNICDPYTVSTWGEGGIKELSLQHQHKVNLASIVNGRVVVLVPLAKLPKSDVNGTRNNDTTFAEASVGTTFSGATVPFTLNSQSSSMEGTNIFTLCAETLAVMMMGLSAIAVSAANNCPPAPAPTSDAKMPGLHEISIGIIHRE
ncbi:cysteine-rich receptor-like protein kinase 8 [Tanacetum coccineum]